MLLEDSVVCCRCALAQLGATPSEALGCCWRQRELPAKTMAITHRERGGQDPASPRRTWYLLSDVYVDVDEVLLLLKAGCPSLSSNAGP